MSNDPYLGVAVHAVRRAAAVIVDAARDLKRRPAHAKDRGDVASNASIESENAIIATIRTAFPEHAIVGKESAQIVSEIRGSADRRARARNWIVDPLAGSLNLRHGYPYCAVSIAVLDSTDVTHAVVLDPIHDDLFCAVKGKGAEHNGVAIRTSACIRLDQALLGTHSPVRSSPRFIAHMALQNALVARCADIRRAGATALDLAYVAAGRLDGFWTITDHPSEIVAGALIVTEAGGRVGDFAGAAVYARTAEVIAATSGIFNPLRDAVAAASRR